MVEQIIKQYGVAQESLAAYETPKLIGHKKNWQDMCQQFSNGQLHHAWVLQGERGIGKATFAFQLAGWILSQGLDSDNLRNNEQGSLYAEESPSNEESADQIKPHVRSRITHLSHPNLLYITRSFNENTGKFNTGILINDVRRIRSFLESSAAEDHWRIIIIDPADDMNREASNAVLKLLEEPPEKTLFLLVSQNTGRLLATILSRALRARFSQLNADDVRQVIAASFINTEEQGRETPDPERIESAINRAQGNPRKAIEYLNSEYQDIRQQFDALMQVGAGERQTSLLSFASLLAPRDKDNLYQAIRQDLLDWIALRARESLSSGEQIDIEGSSKAPAWAQSWYKVDHLFRETEIYNLDRKQTILTSFRVVDETVNS